MTTSQRSTYFGRLWPDACHAQKWHPKNEERRRDVTFAATGQESASKLTQDQVTLLFNKLKWLADPNNFEKAYADANPDLALKNHKRKQVTWRIEQAAEKRGLNEAWLEAAAEHKCAKHKARGWRNLPIRELVNFSRTVSSRRPQAAPVQDACTRTVDPDDIVF
jgi:hypothetical protein